MVDDIESLKEIKTHETSYTIFIKNTSHKIINMHNK